MDFNGLRVLLYVRVSTEEQARHGESVQDQQQALDAWASQHGCRVVGTYMDEGFSARKPYHTRPALRELLEAVERRRADCVVFTKLDRWFRNLKDYYKVDEILQRHGVFWAAILEDYETRTSGGRFKVNLMLSIAEHEADQTSERIKFTFQQKRLRGEIVGASMPRGYKLVDKKPVKDPETQAGMAAFWRAYFLTGKVSAAMDAAAAHGVTFKHYATAGRVLRNAACYAGCIQGVSCEPYITEEQRDMVLRSRGRSPRRTGKDYLFQGLIRCGECGGTLGGHQQGYVKRDGTRSAYYSCARAHQTRGAMCHNKSCLSESDIEAHLLARLDDAMAQAIVDAEARSKDQGQCRNAEKEVAMLRLKMERLTDAYIDGFVSKEDYLRRRTEIDKAIKNAAPKKEPKRKTPEELKAALPEGWREAYDGLDAKHKQAFWRRTVREIVVFGDKSITFSIAG